MPKIDPQSHLPTPDTSPEPDPTIVQAHKDIQRGLVDTDMWATPGLDARKRQAAAPTDPKTADETAPANGPSVTHPKP